MSKHAFPSKFVGACHSIPSDAVLSLVIPSHSEAEPPPDRGGFLAIDLVAAGEFDFSALMLKGTVEQ